VPAGTRPADLLRTRRLEPDLKLVDRPRGLNTEELAMPWNEAVRKKYEVIRARNSSDMLDAEFAR
jgi:hypothetical protein